MIIKKEFTLLKGTPNLLNISNSAISAYEVSDNSNREAFALLKLNEKSINHFSKDKIFKLMENKKDRNKIQIVKFEDYILPLTINKSTNKIIINLKPFDVSDVNRLGVNNLYASIVYGYCLSELVNNKIKIGEIHASVITKFLLSVFVRVFGREYGLLGIYASGIPGLKFLIACYILSSFFGIRDHKKLFKKAISIAPYDYKERYNDLIRYDFSDINQFVKSLSELGIMSGMSVYNFTAKMLKFLGLNFLPALEDLSRYISIIITSSVKGSSLIPAFIASYNKSEYGKILELGKLIFR